LRARSWRAKTANEDPLSGRREGQACSGNSNLRAARWALASDNRSPIRRVDAGTPFWADCPWCLPVKGALLNPVVAPPNHA